MARGGSQWLAHARSLVPSIVLAALLASSCRPVGPVVLPFHSSPKTNSNPTTSRSSSVQTSARPITITHGGTYSGCWASNQHGPAVTIATAAPVRITNSTIKGTTTLVRNANGGVKLSIDHTRMFGLYPGGHSRWAGYAVELLGFDSLRFEHNYIEQKGGVVLEHWSGVRSAHPVLIRYNAAKNIDGRLTNGSGGYSGRVNTQFVQLNEVQHAVGVDISWNEVDNAANASAVEDNINLFRSSGTPASPIDVHDNFINGAYPYPAARKHFTGGGILLADAGGSYEIAHSNQVVSTTNYGVANASGTHTSIYNNRTVSSGRLPNGTVLPSANVGVYSWNQYAVPYGNNSVYNNVSGWMRSSATGLHRNDTWLPDCNSVCTSNSHLHHDRRPITDADTANELRRWKSKLRHAGIVVGP